MIDVTHDRDYGSTRQGFDVRMFDTLFQQCFRIVELGRMRRVAHLFDQNHRGFLIEHLVDGDHLAELHQMFDDFRRFHGHLVRKFGDGNRLRHMHFLDHRFGRRLEIGFAAIGMRRTPSFRTGAPCITATAGIAAGLDAAGAALLGVVLPGR